MPVQAYIKDDLQSWLKRGMTAGHKVAGTQTTGPVLAIPSTPLTGDYH